MTIKLSKPRERPVPSDAGSEKHSPERLQKLIAQAGLASRRGAEEIILAGRVTVNGHVVSELGAKADIITDRVVVDGKPLRPPAAPIVLLLHKPKGYVTTKSDPEGRATVMEFLPKKYQMLHPVGRLDFDTAGALLLTNDGELTNLLTHPAHGVSKTYHARVKGHPTPENLRKLHQGVRLTDGMTAPCQVRVKAKTDKATLVEVVLHEGRNRQVRRMFEAVGHEVRALRRVKFANLDITDLPPGDSRELLPAEIRRLRREAMASTRKEKVAKRDAYRESPLEEKIEEVWEE